jgi:hypothetical protein
MERSLPECDSKLSFRVGRAGVAKIRKASRSPYGTFCFNSLACTFITVWV